MTKDEALKLALEALKRMKRFGNTFGYRSHEQNPYEQVCEAIDVCEKAIAAPVQEPVTLRPEDVTVEVLTVQGGGGFAPLRTHGVKLTHKPTGIVVQCSSERSQHRNREQALRDLERYLHGARPQPTPPAAQRQWVGLTDEEFEDIELGCRSTSSGKIEAMQKVEAKLKEKNT